MKKFKAEEPMVFFGKALLTLPGWLLYTYDLKDRESNIVYKGKSLTEIKYLLGIKYPSNYLMDDNPYIDHNLEVLQDFIKNLSPEEILSIEEYISSGQSIIPVIPEGKEVICVPYAPPSKCPGY